MCSTGRQKAYLQELKLLEITKSGRYKPTQLIILQIQTSQASQVSKLFRYSTRYSIPLQRTKINNNKKMLRTESVVIISYAKGKLTES